MNKPPRIIRKYPNRRLYDTESSTYITLEGIRQLVLDHIPFQVVDKRSNEDITRSILLQIISEQEDSGSPVFTSELLQQVIRFHGETIHAVFGEFLKISLAQFMGQQSRFKTSLDPVSLLEDLTQQNLAYWTSLFPSPGETETKKPTKTQKKDDTEKK